MSDTAASSAYVVSTIHATLTARCGDDLPPGAWRVAAASAGVSGADAFLCHLSRSIVGALEHLAASAGVARSRVNSVRDTADVQAKSHCDELESCVELTEASKRVGLERELCAIDEALERLRDGRDAAAEAVASFCDSELVARHAELTARLGCRRCTAASAAYYGY